MVLLLQGGWNFERLLICICFSIGICMNYPSPTFFYSCRKHSLSYPFSQEYNHLQAIKIFVLYGYGIFKFLSYIKKQRIWIFHSLCQTHFPMRFSALPSWVETQQNSCFYRARLCEQLAHVGEASEPDQVINYSSVWVRDSEPGLCIVELLLPYWAEPGSIEGHKNEKNKQTQICLFKP